MAEITDTVSQTKLPLYPQQYVQPWTMPDGTIVTIRPIRPEDEPLMVKFHEALSDRSVYYRYFEFIELNRRIAHERLRHICFVDNERDVALVVDYLNSATGEHEILGVGRLATLPKSNHTEFAVIVSDRWQKHGLGSELLRRLLQIGRDKKLPCIAAVMLPENRHMQHVCEKLGFSLHYNRDEHLVRAQIDL